MSAGMLSMDSINRIRNNDIDLKLCGIGEDTILGAPDSMLGYLVSLLGKEVPVLPDEPVDAWSGFLSKLGPHRMVPFLHWKMGQLPREACLPPAVTAMMKAEFMASWANSLQYLKQLSVIAGLFRSNDIDLLVLKGPALAWSLYPHPAARPFDDIDLLVLTRDFEKARTIVESLGYQCRSGQLVNAGKFSHHEVFVKEIVKGHESFIELHREVNAFPGIRSNWKNEDLFSRAVEVASPEMTFKTPHPVDALINGALHMATHHKDEIRLIWICDMALLAGKLAYREEWELLQGESVKRKARLAVEQTLKMAQLWFGLEIPAGFYDFSQWPAPDNDEIHAWGALHGSGDLPDLFSLHWSKDARLGEKGLALFHILFPPRYIMRKKYPPRHPGLLPLSYLRRWCLWGKHVLHPASRR
jgi:hypothetical protein